MTRTSARAAAAPDAGPANVVSLALARPAGKRREEQAIAAAARVFARKGYARTSTGDIADALGIRQASLYYYFSSKEDALLQVCELGAAGQLERLREIAASGLPPTEQIRRTIESLLLNMRDRHDFVKVFLTERHLIAEQGRTRLKRLTREYGRVLEQILQRGVDEGVLRAGTDCNLTMRALLGLANSAIYWYTPGGAIPIDAVSRNFCDLVLTGILPMSATEPGKRP